MDHQNWDSVTITKSKSKTQKIRSGEVESKIRYNSNKNSNKDKLSKKLDEDVIVVPKKVTLELRKSIQKARMDKGWKQKELAQKICVTSKVIQQYESGKAIPNGQILNKLSRVLGVRLSNKKKKNKKK